MKFSSILFLLVICYTKFLRADALPPPNIIYFLADDMGMGDTSAYQNWTGNKNDRQLFTPALEELSRRGIRFTNAHSPSSRCTPSRYALLTGRYCWRTHLKHWVLYGVQCDPLIRDERITMPEFLRDAGYWTGLVGKWHLGLKYRKSKGDPAQGWGDADLTQPIYNGPLNHGFDYFYGFSRSHRSSGPNGANGNVSNQRVGPGWIHNQKVIGATGEGKKLDGSYRLHEIGAVLDEKAFEFINASISKKRPFFLYFASPSNHTPHTPSDKIGDIKVKGQSRNVDGSTMSTPEQQRRLDFIYQNDVHVRRFLNYLKKTDDPRRPGKKLVDNTLVIFSSDNGSEHPAKQYTGPLRSHKGSVYEGGHRIPFIASWPAGKIGDGNSKTPGQVSHRLLSQTDIFATFAEIIDKPLPPLQGEATGAEDSVSQLAAMQGKAVEDRIPLFCNDHKEASRQLKKARAWVSMHWHDEKKSRLWKMLMDHRYAYEQEIHPMELYDLTSDPKETKNLINDKDMIKVLKKMIQIAKRACGDRGSTRDMFDI